MLYLIVAIILIVAVSFIRHTFRDSHNKKELFLSLIFLLSLFIFTYASKILLVYKPLLVLHIALLIMGWYSFYRYLVKKEKYYYWIFSPLVSLLLFIIIALFFRENG